MQIPPKQSFYDLRLYHWLGVYGLILLGWGGIFIATQSRNLPPELQVVGFFDITFLRELCTVASGQAGFINLFLMWMIMVLAMMLPTLMPTLKTLGNLIATQAYAPQDLWKFLLGYVLVWCGFALTMTVLMQALLSLGALNTEGILNSPWWHVGLLWFAGMYQFSWLKSLALQTCRQPLIFFIQYWARSPLNSLVNGLRLGILCLSCCWALMALSLVGGMSNLLWMGAGTLFMIIEKLPIQKDRLRYSLGFLLIFAALILSFIAFDQSQALIKHE